MKKLLFIVIGIVVLVGCYGVFQSFLEDSQSEILDPTPLAVTLSGTYVCLPLINSSTTPSEECVFGLKTDDGVYYMVNFGQSASAMQEFQDRKHITAKGFVVLKETLNTDHWAPYNMKGILTMTERQ